MTFKKYTWLFSTALFCYLMVGPLSTPFAYNFSTGVFEFQQKMAKKGNAQAQYKLAYMYEHGQGTEKNLNSAIGWYKKAAKKRFPAAKMRLTYIDTQKNGFKPEKHGAWLSKLKQDASANDGESLFLLATMHRDGYIVKKDLKRASSLFKRAIKKDVPSAEAEYEAVQSILFSQQNQQQEAVSQKKARDSAKKANAEKVRAKHEAQQQSDRKKAEQQRQQQLATQRAKRDKARADRAKADRTRADRERAEKQRLEQEKALKAEEQRKAKEKQAAEEARKAKKNEKPLVDKSMCKGKKAKFLTTCR